MIITGPKYKTSYLHNLMFTTMTLIKSPIPNFHMNPFQANPCQHPIVILRDVKRKDIEALLRFMYNGEVNIGQEQLKDFLKTAQMLQVRGLADVPERDSQRLSMVGVLRCDHAGIQSLTFVPILGF
jgi:BTB/POZ domain